MKWQVKQETKIALGILAGIFLVFNSVKIFVFPNESLRWHIGTSLGGIVMLGIIGLIVRAVDIWLDKKFPFERNPFWRIALQFIITLLAVVAVRLASFPLVQNEFGKVPSRELIAAGFAINVFMTLSLVLSIFGYHFFRKWRQESIVAAELEKEKAQVQYDNLKNQLNPHFLFNALSSLNSLIFENPQLASDFLQQLSKVYRYLLDNKEKNAVTLQTEIEFVSHYIQLLKTRFGDGLQIHLQIDDSIKEKTIVPVTLQILIENAVKHNTTSKDSPLVVRVFKQTNFLCVENNLQKKNAIEISNRHGLQNLKNLYAFINESPIEVIESSHSFIVKVPLS
ncbi:MAG: histidine kinase [Chitinophagales bacterium]|nr:histidine kinase [Chitinophagales bacterium]